MAHDYGTRKTHDDRDGSTHTVKLTAPAGIRQTVFIDNPDLGTVEQVLWPFN